MKDFTKTIAFRNFEHKIRNSISTKKCDIYENLLVYIKNLEEQVIELSNEVDRLKLERGLRQEAGIIDEINTIINAVRNGEIFSGKNFTYGNLYKSV